MSTAILSAKSDAGKAILPLITNKGVLRATKPKDGNAAYVWRMVGFMISNKGSMQCMPVCADFDVKVPADWMVEAPLDWIDAELDRNIGPSVSQETQAHNMAYMKAESSDGTIRGYVIDRWSRGKYASGRRKHYIKTVLDPIYNEIVDSVPK